MYLSHISITIPAGGERTAREFYINILGLREITKGDPLHATGRISLDAGGIELHLTLENTEGEKEDHVGLGCGDVESLKSRLVSAGLTVKTSSDSARKFFTQDPFGNRLEIHVPGSFETATGARPPFER